MAEKITSFEKKFRYCRQSRGFSLIEMAIVLGIVGVLFGAVWVIGRSVAQGHKINEIIRQSTETVNTVRDRFMAVTAFPSSPAPWAGSGTDVTDFFGEGTGSAVTPQHLLPIEMSKGAGSYTHIFGGPFKILTIGFPTAADPVNTMRLELQGIPTAACVQIISQLPMADNGIGIVRVLINGAVLNNVTGYTGSGGTPAWATPLPQPLSSVSTLCNGSIIGTTGPNEIDVDFKLQP